jgi:hypothetical protein
MASTAAAPKKPNANRKEYVTLVSQEGYEFVIERVAAEQSKMIKDMLNVYQMYDSAEDPSDAQGDDDPTKLKVVNTSRLPLEDVSARVLNLICQYLSEKKACRQTMSDFKQLKALDPKKEEDRQLVFDLLLAADYLDC